MARFQGIPLDQAPIEQAPSMAAPRAPRFRGTPLEGPKPVAAPAPVAALAPPPIAEAPAPSEMPDINPPTMPQAAPQPAAGGLGAQIMRFGKDAGASVVAGTGSIMQFPGQVYGLATGDFDTMSTRGGEAVRQFGQSLKSPELQEKERQAQAVIAEAEKDGFGAEVGAVLKTYLSDPVLLANFTVEQLPSLLATMGFGKLAQWGTQVAAKVAQRGAVSAATLSRAGQAGAITGGAAMQGASVGDETRDAILRLPDATFAASPAFQALVASGIDPQAAKEQLALEGARLAGAAGAGISGATATLLPGVERMGFGQASTQGIIRRVLTGGAAEGFQEGLEEGGGRFAQNVAVQQIDPDQSLLQGVGAQGTMGALPGAVTGAGVAALSGREDAPITPSIAVNGGPPVRVEPTFDAPTQPPPPPNPRAGARFGTGDTVLQPAPLSTPRSRSDLAADLADPRPIAEIDAERQQRAREQQVQLASQYGYPAIGSAFTFTLPDGETVQGVMEGVQQTSTEGLARIRGADGQMYVLGADEFTVTEGTGDKADPVVVKTAEDVDIAAQQVEAPTPAQAKAGNYKHAHLEWEGFDIAIETPQGGTRSGVGKDGKPWSVTMPHHYGRLKGTIGADGDQLDITIGPNPEQNGVVWVIDQIDPDTGKFDEHKIMAGFEMGEEAEQAYIDGFSDGRGIDRIGAVERMDLAQLRQWIANGNTKKALAYNGTPKYREYRIPAPAQAPGDNYRGGQRGPAFDLPASQPAPAAEPPQAPAEGAPSRENGAAASPEPAPAPVVRPVQPKPQTLAEPEQAPDWYKELTETGRRLLYVRAGFTAGEVNRRAKVTWNNISPEVRKRLETAAKAPQPEAAPRPAYIGKGPDFASGRNDALAGKPRVMPTYFTKPYGKNARNWLLGWDAGKAEADQTKASEAPPAAPQKAPRPNDIFFNNKQELVEYLTDRLPKGYEVDRGGDGPGSPVRLFGPGDKLIDEWVGRPERARIDKVIERAKKAAADAAKPAPSPKPAEPDMLPAQAENEDVVQPSAVPSSPAGSEPGASAGTAPQRADVEAPRGQGEGVRGDGARGDGERRPERREPRTDDPRAGASGDVRPADAAVADKRPDAEVKGENHVIEAGALGESRPWRQKALDNIRAIELMRQIEAEGRPATKAEQAELALYVGWGGIRNAFPDAQGAYGKGFETIGKKLRELLSDTEYKTAQRSIQYAHYTSETIVREMWRAAQQLGFKGGKVFEPGMGVGNFAGMMPTDVSAASTYHGLELDHTTARIARLLYPRFGIRQDDFTKAPIPADTYDLAIGNPPFADVAIKSDPAYAKHAFLLHDYFFAKSLDAVRPGGLLMFVTSAGTLNKIDTAAREYMADRADFVGAIRLPGDAFEKNAGTSVTTDIIILRKRLPGETAGSKAWTETVERTLPNKDGAKQSGAVNRWISENPEMVLGDEGFFDKLYPGRYGVRSSEGDFAPKLKKAVDALPADVMTPWQETQAERAEVDFGTKERKDGSFYLDASGRLMQMRDRVGQPVPQRGKGATGGKTGAEMARIKKLVPIRDALRAVLDADLSEDSANAAKARKRLNAAYDEFVAEFGPINKAELSERRPSVVQQESARSDAREEARFNGLPFDEGTFDPRQMIVQGKSLAEIARARNAMREEYAKAGKTFDEGTFDPDDMPDIIIDKRPNVDAFMDDPESYRLRAIEDYNDNTGEAKKRPIFERNIITREKEPEIKSVNDALLYVLNRRGRVAIDEIAAAVNITVPQAIEQLGDRIFKLPGTQDAYETRDAYLSGNVRKKLLEAQAAAERNPEFKPNVEALEAVQPTPLTPSEISANLGMPWLPTDVIESFGTEIGLTKLKVGYLPALASWNVSGDDSSSAARTEWGTAERSAPELISDALNRQDPKIYDEVRQPDGTKTRVLNTVATQAAQDKLQAIKAKFSEWVWSDAARADRLATLYNDNYNNLVVRQYDGDYLTTPGIAAGWSWRPHQKRAIARIIQSGNTYLAHAVGAGKTSEMIGAIMEQRRLGLVRKAMVAVPNHMLGQFTKEFYEQYPTAKIAVADERQFHTDRRKQFVANVANDDLDAIVITHSAMGLIPVSPEFQDALIQEQIDNFRDLLSELDKTDRITRRRIENAIERLEQRLLGKAKKQDQVYTFEQMGVDQLFVDEAHLFRKLDFATKMSGVKGISPEGSKAAFDLYVKARYLETINPGRSLVLASGTPVTNTMAELYTVSRYMQPQELAERGLAHFDAWAAAFGDMATELEQDAAGGYKPVTRFAQFVNIPELSAMVRQQMDVVTSNQLEQYVVRPKIKGGRRELHMSEKSPELADYQEQLAGRMKAIANRKGPPKPGDDIILSVINDGRHAAIDMRLVNPDLPADPTSKLSRMIDRVFDIWQKTKRQPFHKAEGGKYTEKPVDYGPATQMIFSNLGIGGSRPFNVHTYIVNELARRGVPRAEIAQIADFKTHVAKQRLFNDMNEGKVRVLIGSTAKMATGVNAQRRLYALHNLDPLWYPADDEQRNGRALRQGNMNPEIEINDYSTKGTYDSTMWGMMARKAGFIQGFFEGDKSIRSIEDLGEASLYEQAKALTTNDPRLIQLTETKQELEKARRRRSAFESEVWSVKEKIAGANRSIAYAKRRIPDVEKDIAQRIETKGDAFKGAVNSKKFDERPEFGNALLAQMNDIAELESPTKAKKIAEVGGFPVMASSQKAWYAKPGDPLKVSVYLDRNGDFQTDIAESESALGLVRSIEYALGKFESERDGYQNNIAAAERTIKDYTPKLEKKFDGDEKIKELAEKLARLEADINADAKARDAAAAAQQAATKAEDESGEEMQSLRNTGRARNGEKVKLGAPIVDRSLDTLRAELYADLREELDRIGLTDVALNLPDYIARGDGEGGVQYSAGRQRFWGDAQVLIEIALTEANGAEVQVDPNSTLHHEAVHAMKRLNLFSPAEWKVLAARSEAVWVKEYGLTDKDSGYNNLPKNLILEEGIARAYEAWKEGQEGAMKGGLIARAFAKIKRFIEAIGNVFRGRGFNTVEGLFEKIDEGKIGRRGREARHADPDGPRKNFKPMYADVPGEPAPKTMAENLARGRAAIAKVLAEQTDVRHAAWRPELGWIDFIWGDDAKGIAHAIKGRIEKDGMSRADAETLVRRIPDVIARGRLNPYFVTPEQRVGRTIVWNNQTVVLRFEIDGVDRRWVITSHEGMSKMPSGAKQISEQRAEELIADATVRGSGASSVATQGELRANLRDQAKAAASGDTGPGISTGLGTASGSRRSGISPTQGAATGKDIPETDSDGNPDGSNDDAMYSLLPKDQASPAESERMAELAGEEIVSGTERDFVNDAGLVKRWVVHPRTIAAYDKDFVPVYRAAVRQFETRDEFAAEIARKAQAYTDLTPEDRAQVDKLLELGRLEGTVYGDAALKDGVTNDPSANEGRTENAVLTKPGETVTLTDRQIEGYKAARASMNTALDLFKAQIIEEWGYDPTEIRSSADILALITDETGDREAEQHKDAAKIVREIEQAQRTGYVPFTRWGQIGIAVRRADSRQMALGIDGEASRPYTTIHYEMIEVDGAVSRLMRAARKLKGRKTAEQLGQFPEVKARLDALKAKYEGDPDVRFSVFQVGEGGPLEQGVKLSDLDMLAEVGRIDDKAWEQVREQLEKAIKMRGFRKHFFGSKNLPGYSVDFERAIADYTIGIAGYLARRKYGSIWDGAVGKIPTTKPKLREYAQKYRDYTQSPQEELQMLRQLGFVFYLTSPASALVNTTQVPLVTVPWLSQFAPGPKVMYHVTKAYKDAFAMTTASRGMDVFDPAKAPEDVREAFQKAWDEGFFVPLNTWEMMGTAQARSQVVRRLSKVSRTAVDAIALGFTVAERLNRIVTWMAAYRLGKQETVRQSARTILAKNALARSDELLRGYTPEKFAGFAIDETQLRMGKVNRPAMMRGAGAAIFQFKGFTMQMIELQFRMVQQYAGRRPKVAVGAMWLLLMLTAGIWGAPFGDDLKNILEWMKRKFGGTDLDLDTELRELVVELTGSPGLAEAFSRGTSRAAGVDLQRIGMGNVLPDDAQELGGIPLDLAWGRLSQAIEHGKRGNWMLALSEMMPAFLKNPIVAMSWGTEGVRSQTSGRVVIPPEKVTAGDIAQKAIGFTPAAIANQRESERAQTRANTATKEVKDRYIGELARLRADILRADTANDAAKSRVLEERFARTLDEIRAFNEGRPLHEMVIVNPKTLKDRIKEELSGAAVRDKNAPKQARPRREEIERIYGEQPR